MATVRVTRAKPPATPASRTCLNCALGAGIKSTMDTAVRLSNSLFFRVLNVRHLGFSWFRNFSYLVNSSAVLDETTQ